MQTDFNVKSWKRLISEGMADLVWFIVRVLIFCYLFKAIVIK